MMNIKDMIPEKVKTGLKANLQSILTRSIKKALKEQGLEKMASRLEEIVPDISEQYSLFEVKGNYLNLKVRGMHAFQISLIDKIIRNFSDSIVIVDIGDSAGTHMQYIKGLYSKDLNIRSLSVNLDEGAVVKIRSKGLEAICAKAEKLEDYSINPDMFLCFETLEHLMDPCKFLNSLSLNTKVKYLIATVPYLANSRIGLHHIRQRSQRDVYAENTHIFELSPDDWRLLIRHSGWRIEYERIYLQYPRRGLWRSTRPLWRKNDFEGFYGFVLSRDNNWSSKYKNW